VDPDQDPGYPDPDSWLEIFADSDPGFEIFVDPDPRIDFFQKLVYLREKSKKRTLDPDHKADLDSDPGTLRNADPDPGASKMRIQ